MPYTVLISFITGRDLWVGSEKRPTLTLEMSHNHPDVFLAVYWRGECGDTRGRVLQGWQEIIQIFCVYLKYMIVLINGPKVGF